MIANVFSNLLLRNENNPKLLSQTTKVIIK